ncbi:MAG: 30S ribosomal protein S7 [Alphaproteobacteria bacterium]|nr:30S ribosomal protein S7 [Alphaproteobacteria bacterium]MBQ8660211.1 30S ribosomal protein S7 [Alphaproteobacteria bacterium]
MSRRKKADKRIINPDPKYANLLVSKFMNYLMVDGKRTVASGIMYEALDTVKAKTKKDELEQFLELVDKVKPSLEVRSRRVGGATYQVPTEVRPARREALAIRWIIEAARKRGEKTMAERLSGEFMDILAGNGASLKKKSDVHKMAEANKAFSHFRW